MDPQGVRAWCEAAKADPSQSVVISLPGEKWSTETVEELMKSVSPDHEPWVMEIKSDPDISYQYALVEYWDGMPEACKRNCVRTQDNRSYRLAHATKEEPSPTGSPQAAARTSPESLRSAPATLSAELCAVLGEIVAQCKKDPTDYPMSGYRKLRMFSGRKPVPSEEEGFEDWLDSATQALEEWEVPERRKKQRIVESLKGPALEAIRNLKMSRTDCNAQEYLDVLQTVFGGTEKISELAYQLEHCYQKKGEKLSDYMGRLDKILHRMILKKGISPGKVDEARAQQVLRGAQPMDPIAWTLRARLDGKNLEYTDLIRMIREEEALLEEKREEHLTEPVKQPVAIVTPAMTPARDKEVDTLKLQMSQVMEMLTAMMAKGQGGAEKPSPRKELFPDTPTPSPTRDREEMLCYNCGGSGHFASRCSSPKKKKIDNRQPAGNFRGPR